MFRIGAGINLHLYVCVRLLGWYPYVRIVNLKWPAKSFRIIVQYR